MIDCEKLKLAHELALKTTYTVGVTFGIEIDYMPWSLKNADDEASNYNKYIYGDDIDDLITKLQELTQPPPKYKVSDEVWVFKNRSVVCHTIFEDVFYQNKWSYTFVGDNLLWNDEIDLYPSREALIEAQIQYWKNLKSVDNIPIEPGDTISEQVIMNQCEKCNEYYKGSSLKIVATQCIKCGEFYK